METGGKGLSEADLQLQVSQKQEKKISKEPGQWHMPATRRKR